MSLLMNIFIWRVIMLYVNQLFLPNNKYLDYFQALKNIKTPAMCP